MTLAVDRLGASLVSPPFPVTAAAAIAYARATNDTNPAHLAGQIAPPLFAVVPALKTMAKAKTIATGGFTLHGEHDLHIERPIVPGMVLTTEATLTGFRRMPGGVLIVTEGVTRDADGSVVNRQYMLSVAQGETIAAETGSAAPGHRFPDALRGRAPDARCETALHADQTRRYAEASGDRSAYTFDDAAARAIGLPGPIVHGLLTMAFLGNGIVAEACGGDSRRLKRFAVRFSGLLMMRAGERVCSRLWRAGAADGPALVACESDDGSGGSIIRHGWAEVAEAGRG